MNPGLSYMATLMILFIMSYGWLEHQDVIIHNYVCMRELVVASLC